MRWFRRRSNDVETEVAAITVVTSTAVVPDGAVSYRAPKVGLRVATRYGAAQFTDGTFTTDDPDIIFSLDGLASRRPDLLAKET